ncbi:MAG: hypothetical protein ACLQU2_24420 [Candidatus Binataceae bacterium]
MESATERDKIPNTVEVPARTAWPMITALGLTMAFAGLVTSEVVSAVGAVLIIAGAVGWFGDVFPEPQEETVAVEPAAAAVAIAPVRVAVAKLEVGEEGHRAVLPLEIYPYSAGIKGGIAGGFVMALLAAIQGLLLHGSPWYTINILAATAMPNMANLNAAALSAFDPHAFIMAVIIHGIVSVLVGLLYGVLLPMLPRNPVFLGGVVAPLLWTGLLYSSLKVINPLLDARIEWRWFILCQIAFGLTAGFVVAHSERIRTFQHLPFTMRMGVEAPGVMAPKEHE